MNAPIYIIYIYILILLYILIVQFSKPFVYYGLHGSDKLQRFGRNIFPAQLNSLLIAAADDGRAQYVFQEYLR